MFKQEIICKFENIIKEYFKINNMEVIGYENYLIYPNGRVYSKKGKGKFIKSSDRGKGYLRVDLYNKGKQNTVNIHRLIALHYIPNPENKPLIDHINRIKTDNRIENLRWATSSENNQNQGMRNTNTSGIKNITKTKLGWRYEKVMNGKMYSFRNKKKQLVLWAKFVHHIIYAQ